MVMSVFSAVSRMARDQFSGARAVLLSEARGCGAQLARRVVVDVPAVLP